MKAGWLAALVIVAGTPLWAGLSLAQDDAERAIASRLPQDYVSLRQRPLFAPDRRPPAPPLVEAPQPVVQPEPEPEPVKVVTAPYWELIGVVRSQRITSAVFRAPAEATTFSLRPGESRDGWTLAEVGRFEVSLRNGDGHAKMRFPDGAGGTTPPDASVTRVIDDNGAVVPIPNPAAE